jgi:peptide/nickel transport system substrate-binding protein
MIANDKKEKGKMKNKTIVLTSVALMLLMLVTPTIVSSVKAAEVKNPYDYISLTIGDPMDADPVFQYDQASLEMLMNIYEPLIFWDFTSTTEYEGIIAEDWWGETCSVTDPKTTLTYTYKWVFKIREDVHFHTSEYIDNFETGHISDSEIDVPGEGAEVTVADVEYSFERNMVTDASTGGECLIWDPLLHIGVADTSDPLMGRMIDFAVQSEIDGAGTVTFYLLTPFEPFLQCVAQMYAPIMCKEWVADQTFHPDSWDGVWPNWNLGSETGNDNPQNYTRWTKYHDPIASPIYSAYGVPVDPSSIATHPHIDYILGTGPYIFDYWNTGIEYRLTKNPYYWKGWSSPGHADNFVSKTIETWATRRDVFKAGDGDVCTVPPSYMSQLDGVAGIIVIKDLAQLTVNPACFFNQRISSLSTYCGTMPANGTFTSAGFPADGFQDIKLRKAFRALFPYEEWIAAAYLGEGIQPASCICKGLAYYNPSILKPVHDKALAIQLLQEAWGGEVWEHGFWMSFCYNSGNEPRKMACEMFRDEFEAIDPKFHGEVTEILWTDYSKKWKTYVLPFYFVGWGADFPDPHNFVVPFMESVSGAFAKFQGFKNETINTWIREGIDSSDPLVRQDRYNKLAHAFIDNCYSVAMFQPLGRHWQRDWAQGFYYHSCMAGEEYAYYRWKQDPAEVPWGVDLDVTVESGGSFSVTVTTINSGNSPNYFDTHIYGYDGSSHIFCPEDWLRPGESISHTVIFEGATLDLYIYGEISKWVPPPKKAHKYCYNHHFGDLGDGPPATFAKFDGLNDLTGGVGDSWDYALWHACSVFATAAEIAARPPCVVPLGDFGSLLGGFYDFDQVVNSRDYGLWHILSKFATAFEIGQRPPPC